MMVERDVRATRSRRLLARGMTLIEVMIVVSIVGILAGIALPSYLDYIQRGKIVEASSSLNDLRTRLEQYYLDHRQYPGLCIPPAAGAAPPGSIHVPGAQKYFAVTCSFPAVDRYTVTATGVATEGMGGFAYTINEGNARGTASLPAGWTGTGNICWVTRRSGTC